MPRLKLTLKFQKTLGDRIRARRQFVNRTGEYVAREVGVTKATLSLYELGKSPPTVMGLFRIAKCLGTSVSELLGEKISQERLDQHDVLTRLYADPFIGAVTRHMQDMTVEQRRAVLVITAALRTKAKPETVEVMK
jgi:transcriptional regulator with XRE-family HTH domain